MEEIDENEDIAFHEAGHAVAAHYCNQEIIAVTIAPTPEEQERVRAEMVWFNARGYTCLGFMLGKPRRVSRTATWDSIRVGIAGPVAEGIRFGFTGRSHCGDVHPVLEAAKRVTSGPKRRQEEYLLRAFDQTEVLIERNCEMVEKLAKALRLFARCMMPSL